MKTLRTLAISPNAPDINSMWLDGEVAKYFNNGTWQAIGSSGDNSDSGEIGDLMIAMSNISGDVEGTCIKYLSNNLLTLVIGGNTEVPITGFSNPVFTEDKTLVYDSQGTLGVYVGDKDSSVVNIRTITTSIDSSHNPVALGSVPTYSDLPVTASVAATAFSQDVMNGDYVYVIEDDTHDGEMYRYAIVNISSDGTITWGAPIGPLNQSDYQAQTGASMAGMILTGGADGGTFGTPLGIDTVPTQGSKNLVDSGSIYTFFLNSLRVRNMGPAQVAPTYAGGKYILDDTLYLGYERSGSYVKVSLTTSDGSTHLISFSRQSIWGTISEEVLNSLSNVSEEAPLVIEDNLGFGKGGNTTIAHLFDWTTHKAYEIKFYCYNDVDNGLGTANTNIISTKALLIS